MSSYIVIYFSLSPKRHLQTFLFYIGPEIVQIPPPHVKLLSKKNVPLLESPFILGQLINEFLNYNGVFT